MNRVYYFNYIVERLSVLSYQIETRGKLNVLDYHLHSEYFYRDFFNLLYGWNLQNLNDNEQNVEAIDLVDYINKYIIQVSATNTKEKINYSLSRKLLQQFKNYSFKFISLAKAADNLRNKQYNIPQEIKFEPQHDIYDLKSILNCVRSRKIGELEDVYDFIRKELGKETPSKKIESSLTTIIQLLSQEDFSQTDMPSPQQSFEIERKIEFNQLENSKYLISEYKIYQSIVDRIYTEFDKAGQNKSLFVLTRIHKMYLEKRVQDKGDNLYQSIVDSIKEIIINSSNFNSITEEELDMSVDILVVDAFIRCKIFENPENYNYATS